MQTVTLQANRVIAELLAASGLARVVDLPDVLWYVMQDPAASALNTVIPANWPAQDVPARVAAIRAAAGAPLRWLIGPRVSPLELGRCLFQQGALPGPVVTGLALSLEDFHLPDMPPLVTIEPVSTAQHLTDAAAVLAVQPVMQAVFRRLSDPLLACQDRLRLVLACEAGEPVGLVWLALTSDGLASVFHPIVLPDARRRGIGLALVAAALAQARAEGCHLGAILTDYQQRGLSQGLGFTECGVFLQYFMAGLHGEA